MAFPKNLSEFYATLRARGAKLTHQFQFNIINTGIGEIDTLLSELTMWAKGSSVPGRTQNFAPISYLAYEFSVPTNFAMTNTMTLEINCDSAMRIRDALLLWEGIFSDPDIEGGSAGGGIKNISPAVGKLYLMNDRMDEVTHEYELVGLYPTNVGEIGTSNVDSNIATFQAEFRYQYWKTLKTPNIQ
jgi:hypothetical protein